METKTIVCSIAIDTHLTFQEFDAFQEHLGDVLHALSSDNIKVSARTNTRRTLSGFSKLASQEDVVRVRKKILDGFFADQSGSTSAISTKELATEALFKTLADSLVAVSERYYQPLAILFTSGRRRIDRKLRNTLVRLARGSAPLIIFRLSNDLNESCCDDDGLIWACSQTPHGLFCRLGIDRIPNLDDVWRPGYQEDIVHVTNDHTLIKLIEYELPRYSMHHLDSILDARQREGFRVQRRDLSPKRYLDEPGELSARLLWSPRLVLEYVVCMDVSAARRLKAQFCLRGQDSLLKMMESNHDLVEFVRECIEVDVVISHLCGPNADAAFQHLLSTQSGQQLARFVKTASMEAICGVSAEPEINTLFPRSHEWIIPKTLVLLTSSWHELERTASKVQDSRKLLLVSPHRMSLAGLFHSTGASVDRASKVLRHPDSMPTEEACQDSLSTLALLWRRRGFFQTSPVDGVAIDFVLLPESDAEPVVRLTASASPSTGIIATVTVQGDCTSMERYIRLLEEDEQVLIRLQTFADLHSPRELLPFARRSIPLELPTFSSLSKAECDRALAAALIEVFTIKVEKDQCHARYVSKDAVVILCEMDGVQTLFDIRRADLLPLPPSGSVTNPPNTVLFHAGSLGNVNPEEEAAHLIQFITRLRSGFSRCIAAIVHSEQAIMLRSEEDVHLVEEGCETTYMDVDISKLTTLDALQDDFAEQLSRVVTVTCGLPITDETQGFFRAHDGFIRLAVRQESKDEMRLNLKNSISILREALFHAKSSSPPNVPGGGPVSSYSKSIVKEERRAWLRIYFLSPFPFPGAVSHSSHARSSTLSVSSVREGRTIASIEKEIGILVSTTILQFARRILVSKPDLAIRLVRDILASVSESIRLDIPLLPFVLSTSFEQDEDKLDLFAKELAGQTEFPLRLVSQHSPHGLMLIHSDEECWALLTITLGSIHVDMWSFADPASQKASARVSECVMRIQRRTNQLLLLSDLHETRMASSQLVPVTSSDYPFFACPSQRHLDIPLGQWVSKQRMLKELGSSPVFFVRNRERWFVYRALNHKIAYFTVIKNEDNEENGKSSSIFSIELFAIDSLNQNAVDHLQKLLKEMVVELAVESLAAHIQQKQQQQHQLGAKLPLPNLFLNQKEWDLDLLISQDASTNKHSHDFPCNATNLSRHLTTAIKKRLLVVIGEDPAGAKRVTQEDNNSATSNKVTLLCLVEDILLIVSFEEQGKLTPSTTTSTSSTVESGSNVVKTEIWIPTRRGNSSKAVRAFLDGFADALKAAERAAHFEQRLLAEQDSITDFEALVAAAREACGSNTVDLFRIFEKSTMEMRDDDAGVVVAAAAEMIGEGGASIQGESNGTVSEGVLPNWSTLYLLRDVERRVTHDLKFEKTHAFRSWLRRTPGLPPTWSLLQPDDEERILQAGEDGMISATKLEEADSSAKRRGPFSLESLAVVIANKPFWLKQRSASMPAPSPLKPASKRLSQVEDNTTSATLSSGMRKLSVQSLTGLIRDEANLVTDDGLKILLVLATPSSVETVGFAVEEAQLTLVQESVVASATWLIGRLQALANPAVRVLAGFGKRRSNWPNSDTAPGERSSRRASIGSISPRVSNLESTGRMKKQDSAADPAQEVARWTQERRAASGSNVGLRGLADVIRVFRSCRPIMSFRVPALCSFPDPDMMSSKELLLGSSSILAFDLNMTLVCESDRFCYYFCILGGTHLLMAKLYSSTGGGVGVEAQVRELGKHNGGTTLCLALANVHEALPKIRAAVHDTYVSRIAKMVLIERHLLGPQTAIDFGRMIHSEGWEGAKGITSDQIACEVFNVLEIEFEEWTKALFERVSGPSNFVLGNALVHRDARFDCILYISRVSPSPIVPRCAFVYAELCVIAQKRTDLSRAVGLATPWAKHRVEMCAADVRWRSFWRMVKRSNARSEIQSLVLEEDMIGEEARVSLTLIDPRFDDLLGCIEHGVAWLGPLQRALTQAGWLVVTVKQHANASPNGLLLSREDCADRFAIFAAIVEDSTVFDLMSRVESDVRSFPPELQSMLSWLLRVLGAIFLDACVARVNSIFDLVGLENAFITDLADSDTDEEQQSNVNEA